MGACSRHLAGLSPALTLILKRCLGNLLRILPQFVIKPEAGHRPWVDVHAHDLSGLREVGSRCDSGGDSSQRRPVVDESTSRASMRPARFCRYRMFWSQVISRCESRMNGSVHAAYLAREGLRQCGTRVLRAGDLLRMVSFKVIRRATEVR